MFSMSLKSVPGSLVSIAPMLMGVPVAWTPGLVPQADVETVLALEVDDAELAALVLELELELHAARTPSDSAATAAAAARVRQWTDLFMCSAFSSLTACHYFFRGVCAPPHDAARSPRASRRKTPFTSPQVNGASSHSLSNVVRVEAAIEVFLDYGHHTETGWPRTENGFITFPRFSVASFTCPVLPGPELNGDDRMAAEPGQSARPPNSQVTLLRQVTNLQAHKSHRHHQ